MQIAVISDIHDNIVNLKKFLSWCAQAKIDRLICCGDVTNGETLKIMAQGFSGPIHLVEGNIALFERTETEQYKNIRFYGQFGRFRIGKTDVGLMHEPNTLNKVLALGNCDLVFYGHTHKPWEETKKGTRLINPGTLSGMFTESSFAVWDAGKNSLNLKLLHGI